MAETTNPTRKHSSTMAARHSGALTLVGILEGESRLGVADFAYADNPLFVLARRYPFQIIYARDGAKDATVLS